MQNVKRNIILSKTELQRVDYNLNNHIQTRALTHMDIHMQKHKTRNNHAYNCFDLFCRRDNTMNLFFSSNHLIPPIIHFKGVCSFIYLFEYQCMHPCACVRLEN